MKARRNPLIAAAGLAGALASWGYNRRLKQQQAETEKIIQANIAKPILSLKGQEQMFYPWGQNLKDFNLPDNWEFRKVKMRGALSKTMQLVYRERNGEKGYLVFKSLFTASSPLILNDLQKEPNEIRQTSGIMVNLGWVPESKLKNLKDSEITFLKKYEEDSEKPYLFAQLTDPYNGLTYDAATEDEVDREKEGLGDEEVVITGYLRKGEKPNWLLGKRYWHKENFNALVDLDKMVSFSTFGNYSVAREYYLEAALPKLPKDIEETDKIIPASFKKSDEEVKEYLSGYNKLNKFYNNMGWILTAAAVLTLI